MQAYTKYADAIFVILWHNIDFAQYAFARSYNSTCYMRSYELKVVLHLDYIRSGAVFRSEGSPLNPKDLLQIYVILAVGACVLCQFKVCCDVC